jgi:hypothetical protein
VLTDEGSSVLTDRLARSLAGWLAELDERATAGELLLLLPS